METKHLLMLEGARKVVEVCGGAQPSEQVLIVADYDTTEMGMPLLSAIHNAKAEPVMAVMPPRKTDGLQPPEPVAAAMKRADLFICLVSKSITHTSAVKNAVQGGSRGLMLTQFTPDMLMEGGIDADFSSLAPAAEKMAETLQQGSSLTVTSSAGTDFSADIGGRPGNALTCMVQPGEFSPLPNVEANVSPVEGTAEGRLVFDGSIPYADIGIISDPVTCRVERGEITGISGGKQADQLRGALAGMNDPAVYNIAEVGVGLNPCCRLKGLMLEDEGVYGSVHIGIGTSITLGGRVKAACHYDLIMLAPTLRVDGVPVLQDGQLIL